MEKKITYLGTINFLASYTANIENKDTKPKIYHAIKQNL